MIEEVRIPEISENVTSGKVVSVLVKEGDRVEVDDILIEFETEKALVEIPSTAKGKIVEMLAREGQEMSVGDVIAKVETEAGEDESAGGDSEGGEPEEAEGQKEKAPEKEPREEKAPKEEKKAKPEPEEEEKKPSAEPTSAKKEPEPSKPPPSAKQAPPPEDETRPKPEKPVAAAPSVRRFARELGVAIHQVRGTGPGSRITPDDVKAAVRDDRRASGKTGATAADDDVALPDFGRWGEVEHVEMPGVRRLTARSTAASWRAVPHVTQFDRADIGHVQAFVQKNAPQLKKQDIKLTITAVIMKVCAQALLRFPRFNASIDMANNRLVFKKYVHIGMAVDTERGLLVPVVRDADRKSIGRLASEIADLAERSRTKKIKPEEMEGGTFTISNQGGIGGTQFTPIVMWPQAAILGVSRATTEPVFIDGAFTPRPMLPLALSYDHRLIDGADAARFVRWLCESLEQPLNIYLD
jgi:pyruvate dehydrogenase E2 component (dihydrolipoamide acetyltransferase)